MSEEKNLKKKEVVNRMSTLGLIYCILTAIFWAVGPVFLRKSLDTFDNVELNAARCVAFVSVSALICVIQSPSLLLWKHGLPLLALVVVITMLGNLLGDLCYFVAIDNIGLGRAIATSNSYPIIVSLISVFFLGESPTLRTFIGTLTIIIGLAMLNLTKKSALPPSDKVRSNKLGFFMAVTASVSWAVMLSTQKWMITTYNIVPATYTLWRAISLIIIAWAIWYVRKTPQERKHLFDVGIKKWVSPFIAGSLGLALGGFTFASALEIVPISLASPITASNPIIAAIIAKFMFKEKLSTLQWIGILLVIIGGIEVSS